MTEKRYRIWLVVVWSDLGASYNTVCALTYKPEDWFADMWRKTHEDYSCIVELTTNLSNTDPRLWHGCTVTRSDYHDNEHFPIAVSNVGFGEVPVIQFQPNGKRVYFEDVK